MKIVNHLSFWCFMGFFKKVGTFCGWFVDIRVDKWIGYKNIKSSFSHTRYSIKSLFTIEKKKRTESFDEAIQRLQLTEDTLQQRRREFFYLSLSFSLITSTLFAYFLYSLLNQYYIAALISFLFSIFMGLQGFRFVFWHYQIRTRRLGCSFKECLSNLFTKE
jgi:intracellular multiplication protein IcmV